MRRNSGRVERKIATFHHESASNRKIAETSLHKVKKLLDFK
jgi:hypothetical protein